MGNCAGQCGDHWNVFIVQCGFRGPVFISYELIDFTVCISQSFVIQYQGEMTENGWQVETLEIPHITPPSDTHQAACQYTESVAGGVWAQESLHAGVSMAIRM